MTEVREEDIGDDYHCGDLHTRNSGGCSPEETDLVVVVVAGTENLLLENYSPEMCNWRTTK